jgi:hypothetical protein
MTADQVRDAAATVAGAALFVSAWFAKLTTAPEDMAGTAGPGRGGVSAAGRGVGFLTWQRRSRGSVFDQERTGIGFGVVGGVEFAVAGGSVPGGSFLETRASAVTGMAPGRSCSPPLCAPWPP